MALATLLLLGATVQTSPGEAILHRVAINLAKYKSVKGKVWHHTDEKKTSQEFRILQPEYVAQLGESMEVWQYGRKTSLYFKSRKEYQIHEVPSTDKAWKPQVGILTGFDWMFNGGTVDFKSSSTPAIRVSFEGVDSWLVHLDPLIPTADRLVLYVDAKTYLPAGYEREFDNYLEKVSYSDVILGPDLKPEDFKWTPPKGAVQTFIDDFTG